MHISVFLGYLSNGGVVGLFDYKSDIPILSIMFLVSIIVIINMTSEYQCHDKCY